MTTTALSKATAGLLRLASGAASDLGAEAVVLLPEGPMDWAAVREACDEARLLIATAIDKHRDAAVDAGLVGLEVEPTDASIAERITLALIQAVADDHLKAGARVVVVYSGFEAETLDSITVVRLGEHLERLTARDLPAPGNERPVRDPEGRRRYRRRDRPRGARGEAGRHLDRRGRCSRRADPVAHPGVRPVPRIRPQGAEPARPAGPRGDQGDRAARWSVRRLARRHDGGRLPDHRRPDHRV